MKNAQKQKLAPSTLVEGSAEAITPAGRKLVADTGKLSGATGASYFINLVGGLILARLLGPALYGIWKTVQMVLDFTTFSNFGSINGVDRLCPSMVSQGKLGRYRRSIGASLGFSLTLASMVSLMLLAWGAGHPPGQARVGILALVILVFIQPFFTHGEAALGVEKRFGAKAKMIFVSTTLRIVFSIAAALLFDLAGVLTILILTIVGAAIYMISRSRMGLMLNLDGRRVFALVRAGLPITGLGLGERLLMNADKIIVVSLLGAEAMGLYQMAVFSLPVLLLVPFSLRQVVNIDVYDKFGQTGDLAVCRDVYERSVSVIALSSPFIMGAVYFGVPMLVDWFLDDYVRAIPAIKAFSILSYSILIIQTAFVIAIVARRVAGTIQWLVSLAAISAILSFFAARTGMSFLAILGIHASGWLVFAFGFLLSVEHWLGAKAETAIRQVLLWFLPMLAIAIELPAVDHALQAMGLVQHSLFWAVVGGVIHSMVCLPMFVLLERQTHGVSYVLRAAKQRISGG